jgi:putative transposase
MPKLKKRNFLKNYYLPRELEERISIIVEIYTNKGLYESLKKLTPGAIKYGWLQADLEERERIKKFTIQNRRLLHQLTAE